jgi:uncharacterized membrane protein
MEVNMSNNKKLKRTAMVLMGIVSLLILMFSFDAIRGIIRTPTWDGLIILNYVLGLVIIISILTSALCLLLSIQKKDTPFNPKNVKLLKIIAILLIIYEPVSWAIFLLVTQRHTPFPNADNFTVTDGFTVVENITEADGFIVVNDYAVSTASYFPSLSGVVLASGLVLLCVAFVFQYGISLQTQVDETL